MTHNISAHWTAPQAHVAAQPPYLEIFNLTAADSANYECEAELSTAAAAPRTLNTALSGNNHNIDILPALASLLALQLIFHFPEKTLTPGRVKCRVECCVGAAMFVLSFVSKLLFSDKRQVASSSQINVNRE